MSEMPSMKAGFDLLDFQAADWDEIQRFCSEEIRPFSRDLPGELWHYTDANGLLGILDTKSIWATHVSCLNDPSEHQMLNNLVLEEVIRRHRSNADTELVALYSLAETALSLADFHNLTHYIACFTEAEDDLGQWRGYGSGDAGYAIGFQSNVLRNIPNKRGNNSALLPICYDRARHEAITRAIVDKCEAMYRAGLRRGVSDQEKWAGELIQAFATASDVFACLIKHPEYSREAEHRLLVHLQPGEQSALQFRQKRSLLARHLPVSLLLGQDQGLLLTRIVVGPSPNQRVCKASVEELLRKHGYCDLVPVELSQVPYRVP